MPTVLAACVTLLALAAKSKGKGGGKGAGHSKQSGSQQRCSSYVSWAMRVGIKEHPERFPGLNKNSTWAEVQQRLHQTTPASRCPDTSGTFSTQHVMPTFTSRLGLNTTQLAAYRNMRKRHSTELSSRAFKSLSVRARGERRKELAVETAHTMGEILDAKQLAIFHNRTASPRRPPALALAATLWPSSSTSSFKGRSTFKERSSSRILDSKTRSVST